MEPQIKNVTQKKLIGKRLTMSLADNKTAALWKSFMPARQHIKNSIGTALYSLQQYQAGYFDTFSPHKSFEKWAAVEVTDFDTVADGMETYTLPHGLYAVFHYKGASTDNTIFQYIFNDWLPKADYVLDDRPHFEILGDNYKNGDPASEEEIWIPVKPKSKP